MKTFTACLLAGCVAGPAFGGLVITNGQVSTSIPSNNDFKSDLNGLGFDRVYNEGSDIMATQTGQVLFYYHAAESTWDNQFVINGTVSDDDLTPGTVLRTEADENWLGAAGEFIGSINIAAGQKFSDLGIGFNVTNGNPNQAIDGPAGTVGFGAFFNEAAGGNGVSYRRIYVGFDDNGHQLDDNHDDMIISAVFVPEPGSMALLGLGGLLVARRRRR